MSCHTHAGKGRERLCSSGKRCTTRGGNNNGSNNNNDNSSGGNNNNNNAGNDGVATAADCVGHGTHVAATVGGLQYGGARFRLDMIAVVEHPRIESRLQLGRGLGFQIGVAVVAMTGALVHASFSLYATIQIERQLATNDN